MGRTGSFGRHVKGKGVEASSEKQTRVKYWEWIWHTINVLRYTARRCQMTAVYLVRFIVAGMPVVFIASPKSHILCQYN